MKKPRIRSSSGSAPRNARWRSSAAPGWDVSTGLHFAAFAERWGIPVAGAFRRQDAIANTSSAWAGNLGYGPNPKLVQRIRDADLLLVVGARLGEATTDGYTLVTPDHPGQTLIHVHPDPEELNRVYHADMAVCCDVGIFAEMLTGLKPLDKPFAGAAEAHAEWLDWSTPKPREGVTLDLGQCVAAMRERLGPDDAIICNGAGNFSGWWHRYWHYGAQPTQLAPTSGAMGYGTPAAVAAALRLPDRLAVALAGDGDFMMNGQELATAIQHDVKHAGADHRQRRLWNDPHASGARVPCPTFRHHAAQPGFCRARPRPMAAGPKPSSRPTNSRPR
ncbi:thiamine pyrophosphate enzyme, central domain-containing protein [Ditylenchus destructor]|uniref:Thiamine pyrophosphate enzyme, central domain-containing protein n=1 Tax=Ditylenchus destructor TaxID=166010 RepID=A0AAD4MEC6_9BILA|nr:thiamine pyrophosphate enzyme, central domain-containing protein [Ditylenchus destructor]